MVTVEVAGEMLALLPDKALLLPRLATLLVADVHLGKAVSFRRLGVPVPSGTTADTLARLDALVEAHAVERIVFLGDFLHSRHAQGSDALKATQRWRERHAGLSLTLVRGNHDDRAGDPPAALGIACVDEPYRLAAAPGLALCHHPQAVAGGYALAGHLHPCLSVGRGMDRLRLPCFHFGAEVGVLPAFGGFTGMCGIDRLPGDRVWLCAGTQVAEVPEAGL